MKTSSVGTFSDAAREPANSSLSSSTSAADSSSRSTPWNETLKTTPSSAAVSHVDTCDPDRFSTACVFVLASGNSEREKLSGSPSRE